MPFPPTPSPPLLATTTVNGLVSTASQSFAGLKTFTSGLVTAGWTSANSSTLIGGASLGFAGSGTDSAIMGTQNTGSNFYVFSNIGSTAASPTIPAFRFRHINGALDPDDAIVIFNNNAGSNLFKVSEVGDSTILRLLQLGKSATGSIPVASAGNEGSIIYDTTTQSVKFSNGSIFANIASGGGSGGNIGDAVTGGTPGSLLFVDTGPVLAQDNANLFWNASSLLLGLGTNTPTVKLDLVANAGAPAMKVQNLDPNGYSVINFYDDTGAHKNAVGYANLGGAGPWAGNAYMQVGAPFLLTDVAGNILLSVNDATSFVGIGTGTPSEKLDVGGNITVGGYIKNVNDPASQQDAATKNSVELAAAPSILSFASTTTGTTIEYIWPGYGFPASATEFGIVVPFSGRVKRLYVKADVGPSGDGVFYTVRANGIDQSLAVGLPDGELLASDTVNEFNVSDGVDITIKSEPGPSIVSGPINLRVSIQFTLL